MATMTTVLGGKRTLKRTPKNQDEVVAMLRAGFSFRVLEAVAEFLAVQSGELAELVGITPRTLARRKKSKQPFKPDESDRLFRVARIAAFASDVLGTPEKAARWLKKPNRALGGVIPLTLLDTDVGAREVENVLGRIAHGVFS